jgi:hypothetical protein
MWRTNLDRDRGFPLRRAKEEMALGNYSTDFHSFWFLRDA